MRRSLFDLLAVDVPNVDTSFNRGTRITESRETHDDAEDLTSVLRGSTDDALLAWGLVTKVEGETYDDDEEHFRGPPGSSDDLYLRDPMIEGSTLSTRVDGETYDDSGWTPDLHWS